MPKVLLVSSIIQGNQQLQIRLTETTTSSDGLFEPERLEILYTSAGIVEKVFFQLNEPLELPNYPENGGILALIAEQLGMHEYKLKKPSEIGSNITDEARRRKLAAWDELREKLRAGIKIKANATGAGEFFNLTGSFAGAMTANLYFDLGAAIDPETSASDADVLKVVAKAIANVALDDGNNQASTNIGVYASFIVRANDLVNPLVLKFDFEVPDLPGLNVSWPEVKLSRFDLPSIPLPDLPDFSNIIPFRLPVPGQIQQKLNLVWDAEAEPKFGISFQDGELSLLTKTVGQGKLVFTDAAGTFTELVRIEHFEYGLASTSPSITLKLLFKTCQIQLVQDESFDLGPFVVRGVNVTADIKALTASPFKKIKLETKFEFERFEIRANTDPSIVLALKGSFTITWSNTGDTKTVFNRLELLEPSVGVLIDQPLEAVGKLVRLIGRIPLPDVNTPGFPGFPQGPGLPPIKLDAVKQMMQRLAALLGAALDWLVGAAGAASGVLKDIAGDVSEFLEDALNWIQGLAKGSGAPDLLNYLVVEVRLDPNSFNLKQIILTPAAGDTQLFGDQKVEKAGFTITLPALQPALVLDLDKDWYGLVIQSGTEAIKVETDLWLDRPDNDTSDAVREEFPSGGKPAEKLVSISITPNTDATDLILLAIADGKLLVLQKYGDKNGSPLIYGAGQFAVSLGEVTKPKSIIFDDYDIKVDVQTDRILPFMKKGREDSSGFQQYFKIKDSNTNVKGKAVTVGLTIEISFDDDFTADTDLEIQFDLETFKSKLVSGDQIKIWTTPPTPDNPTPTTFSPFGLTFRFSPKDGVSEVYPFMRLILAGDDVGMALAKDTAELTVSYDKLSDNRPLELQVSEFGISQAGIDLNAAVSDVPVLLSGVGTPFKFDSGSIAINSSRVVGGSLSGSGPLPPQLVGEANAEISLTFGRNADNRLVLENGLAKLTKQGEPLYSEGTRFKITLDELGLGFVNDRSYHFFFELTGSAEFNPKDGEFSSGLLKNIRQVKLKLNRAPLAADPKILARHISFYVKIDPPASANIFDLFTIELRGISFHPASPAFGNVPAIALTGQVKFAEIGDVIKPDFDFHQLWIAPPEDGKVLPRIRFDGLGVDLKLGGTARVRGSAIAVDDQLPTLFEPGILPADVTANGFLAAGGLEIKGWPSMSASMGFLELAKDGVDDLKHAFYLYGQQNKLSQVIPTPIGEIYLREVGFGFGYRYTLAGLAQADDVTTPNQLVKLLDGIARYAGNLDNFKAWNPDHDKAEVTLAMRALMTVTSASTNQKYNAKKEEKLPNPVLFDVTAALRSDLTFLMNIRAWIALNYHTWQGWSLNEPKREKPSLLGYMYISVPRQEFLARALNDPSGYIGENPPIPKELKRAMASVNWSSTLYIRPGLFHMEFGWPYELGIKFGDKNKPFYMEANGGVVFRIEDASLLYGIALRARGIAQIGGKVGGSSLGASARGEVKFYINAKLIAFIATRPVSDTFFYGAIRIDASVRFSVRVWLQFKIFRKKIRLSAGFSVHLTLMVAVSVVVMPTEGIGGRAKARLGVSAFGRTLTVGVGFSFNDNQLNTARARVRRFMSLGLGAELPSSETIDSQQETSARSQAASSALISEAPRSERAARLEEELSQELHETDTPNWGLDPNTPVVGESIRNSRYWAFLLPTTHGDGDWYIMQLVPRDHTGETAGGEFGTFFAPPRMRLEAGSDYPVGERVKAAYKIKGHPEVLAALNRFLPDQPDSTEELAGSELSVNYGAVVGSETDASETTILRMGEFLHDAFLDADPDEPGKKHFSDLEFKEVKLQKESLGPDTESALRTLEMANRRIDLQDSDPTKARIAAVEDIRSSIIGNIMESVAAIAQAGSKAEITQAGSKKYRWLARKTEDIDARDFGLTFLVSKEALEDLFELKPHHATAPSKAKFAIQTLDADTDLPDGDTNVELFNPVGRMYVENSPRIAEPSVTLKTNTGYCLNWDLEPMWGDSDSVYQDPEFHLKHYRVVREFEGLRNPYATVFTVKSGTPIEDIGSNETRILKPEFQMVDTLSEGEIPEELRQVLLNDLPSVGEVFYHTDGDQPSVPRYNKDRQAHEILSSYRTPGSKEITLKYIVTPVDIAGTEGTPFPLEYMLNEPEPLIPPIPQMVTTIRLPEVRNWPKDPLGKTPSELKDVLTFGMNLVLPEYFKCGDADDLKIAFDEILLRIRREPILPSGSYGSDAVSDAKSRPGPREMGTRRDDDIEFKLSSFSKDLGADGKARVQLFLDPNSPGLEEGDVADATIIISAEVTPLKPKDGVSSLESLLIALSGADQGAYVHGEYAVRVFAQPSSVVRNKSVSGAWVASELVLTVRESSLSNVPVELFEYPYHVELPALTERDLGIEAGMLFTSAPPASAEIKKLLGDSGTAHLIREQDTQRRQGVKLDWRAFPQSYDDALLPLIGGYQLFEYDPDSLPSAGNLNEFVKPIGDVQLLSEEDDGLYPAAVDDFRTVETFYPSDAARKKKAVWFSQADSLPLWPRRILRQSLLSDLDDAYLTELLEVGRPDAIKVQVSWPKGAPIAAPEVKTYEADKWQFNATQGFTTNADRIDIPLMRQLAFSLNLDITDDHYKIVAMDSEARQADGYPDFDSLEFKLIAMKGGRKLKEVTVETDLQPTLHPVLADALDYICYEAYGTETVSAARSELFSTGKTYRRFEVVVDHSKQVVSTDLMGWLEETGPQHDPSGWLALRSMGLAAGIRLFDSDSGEYLKGTELARRAEDAFRYALKRYKSYGINETNLGQPFVDLLLKPGGLYSVAQADGPLEAQSKDKEIGLVENEALSILQLSLRPEVDQWRAPNLVPSVAYFYADIEADFTLTYQSDVIIDITRNDTQQAGEETLAPEELSTPLKLTSAKTEITWKIKEKTRFVFRVTSFQPDAARREEDFDSVLQTIGGVSSQVVLEQFSKVVSGKDAPEAIGRFGDHFPKVTETLLLNIPLKADDENQKQFTVNELFEENLPPTVARPDSYSEEHVKAWIEWHTRFFEKGRGRPELWDGDDTLLPFSLSSLPQLTPTFLAADDADKLDLLLISDEKYGKRRRYAVKPFSRYDAFIGVNELTRPVHFQDENFIEAFLPRTEPLPKPALLNSRRLPVLIEDGYAIEDDSDYGEIELVIGRVPDDVISAANRAVEAGYGFGGLGVSFYRSFPYQTWMDKLRRVDNHLPPDGLEAFGPTELAPPDKNFLTPVIGVKQQTDDETDDLIWLRDVVPDAWAGSVILRARGLPYFFNIHTQMFYSAGDVVSELTHHVFEEGRYTLKTPAVLDADEYVTEETTYDVVEDGSSLKLIVSQALVRFLDCMDESAKNSWLRPEGSGAWQNMPSLFTLPEPKTSYRISVQSFPTVVDAAPELRTDTATELEITPRPEHPDPTTTFHAEAIGTRLGKPDNKLEVTGTNEKIWRLQTTAEFSPRNKVPEWPEFRFEPVEDNVLDVFVNIKTERRVELNPLWVDAWLSCVPRRGLEVTVDHGAGDWSGMHVAIEQELARLNVLAADSVVREIQAYLRKFLVVSDLAAFQAEGGGQPQRFDEVPYGTLSEQADNGFINYDERNQLTWPQSSSLLSKQELFEICNANARLAFLECMKTALAAYPGVQENVAAIVHSFARLALEVERQRVYTSRGGMGRLTRSVKSGMSGLVSSNPETRLFDMIKVKRIAAPSPNDVRQILHDLESIPGQPCIAETAEVLIKIELGEIVAGTDVEIPVSTRVLDGGHFSGAFESSLPDFALLRVPPSNGELSALFADTGAGSLFTLFLEMADDQLFGRGKKLVRTAVRGNAKPVSDIAKRKIELGR